MLKTKTILLVEDNEFLSKLTANRLKKEGFKVDVAKNGNKAISMIENDTYGLILLDLVMPEKDGFEVLCDLKERKNKIPIFVFTNLSQMEDKKEVLQLGASKYFIKADIIFYDLLKEIKEVIS